MKPCLRLAPTSAIQSREGTLNQAIYFRAKNRMEIIDLEKTTNLLSTAKDFVKSIKLSGKQIIFVGTKPEARHTIEEAEINRYAPCF